MRATNRTTYHFILLFPLFSLMISCGAADKFNERPAEGLVAREAAFAEENGYLTAVEIISEFQSLKDVVMVRMRVLNVSDEIRLLEFVGPQIAIFEKKDSEKGTLIWSTRELVSQLSVRVEQLEPGEEMVLDLRIHPEPKRLPPGSYYLEAGLAVNPENPQPPMPLALVFEMY